MVPTPDTRLPQDLTTLQQCYQQVDEATLTTVALSSMKLHEDGVEASKLRHFLPQSAANEKAHSALSLYAAGTCGMPRQGSTGKRRTK